MLAITPPPVVKQQLAPADERGRERQFNRATALFFAALPKERIPSDKEIVLSCYIEFDGRGDLAHTLNIGKILRRELQSKIVMIVKAHPFHQGKISFKNDKYETFVVYDKVSQVFCEDKNREELMARIRKSALFIDVSYPISSEDLASLRVEVKEKHLQVHEYNMANSSAVDDRKVWVQMGVGEDWEGILIEKSHKARSFKDLKDSAINAALMGTATPTPEQIEAYKASHQFHFCYMSNPDLLFSTIFLYSLVAAQKESEKTLDIFLPIKMTAVYQCGDRLVPKDLSERLSRKFFAEQGIGTLQVIYREKGIVKIAEEKVSDAKKVLRLIDLFPLQQHADMKILIHESAFVTGSRGDSTFSEVVEKKFPAYEISGQKRNFAANLTVVAKRHFGENSLVAQFYNIYHPFYTGHSLNDMSYKWFDKECQTAAVKLAAIMNNPDFTKEAKEFVEIINEKYRINTYIVGLVKRKLLELRDGELKRNLDTLKAEFIAGRISDHDLEGHLKKMVDSQH